MYQVLARTWRPHNFGELVGQRHVTQSLTNAIESRRVAHAYLFAGLRGTGKTTVARILAKCLNCETGPTVTPCDRCAACQEIAEGRALDVLEIDAASRTKVDQTRELLELVSYAPARDRHKILIIDETHMLSRQSFNALLKTIEEPPPNVIFILATTELQKVPPTILSRCQVFEFKRVPVPEVKAQLRRIADSEGLEVTDLSLERIARAGEGSVRDALSVLERVIALAGSAIADEEVLRALGTVRIEVLATFVRALAARDAAGMLSVLDAVVHEGHDLLHFWSELVGALRDLLVLDALPERGDLLLRSPEETATLRAAGEGLSREDVSRAFGALAQLEMGLKSSSQPGFLFEATLIRLASLGAVRPIEELLEAFGGGAPLERPQAGDAATAAPRAMPAANPDPPAAPGKKKPAAEDVAERLLAALAEARPMVGAMLVEASLTLDAAQLFIDFPPGMEALRRQFDRPEHLDLVRQQARQLCGRAIEVRLRSRPAAEVAAKAAPAAPRPARTAPAAPGPDLLEQARSEPGVQTLLDVFGAQVVDIRPLATAHEAPLEDLQ